MAVYDTLKTICTLKNDAENGRCTFNGYVEDYLLYAEDELSDEWKDLFNSVIEIDSSAKICVDLQLDINPNVVTNRIIRYKDAFKLSKRALVYPVILYASLDNGEERAIIVCDTGKDQYLKAKGLYYCMSEPLGMFENSRNEIIAVDLGHAKTTVDALLAKGEKTGAIQRRLDTEILGEYNDLKEYALKLASDLKERAKATFAEITNEEKEAKIKETIIMWFLIKKLLYVQYMMSKKILNDVHKGDIKAQRSVAKANADSVVFTSYSELWKL